MSTPKKTTPRKTTAKKSPAKKSRPTAAAPKRPTTTRRPAKPPAKKPRSTASRNASAKAASGRSSAHTRTPAAKAEEPSTLRRIAGDWGRYLWALVVAVVIAALLFEFTMIWTIGVGFYMLALGEFTGLWLLVGGYALACTPAAFGLLIATGKFWKSMTHSLWIGLVYGALGFTFLDTVIGAL